MTLPRLEAVHRYWAGVPPLHEAVTGWLGMRKAIPGPTQQAESHEDPFTALINDFNGLG
ncbi:hypothetical protein BH11GEM2_BH11GEM2_26600 [soil metagenome]|jgi:hypothetical protein